MGTLKKLIEDSREVSNPHVVKVVTNHSGDALYFSRCPIPFVRDQAAPPVHFKHIGLYVYRRDFLLAYPSLKVGPLEQFERLEQLRALENGFAIRVVETDYDSIGVDTPQDLDRVAELFEASLMQGVKTNG
jgi:3-deoxy-manno-octulosonate cytidylyltransferase (CMP-KDO synthetase)